MRIRSRLLVLVLAVLVPAFLTAALGVSYIYSKAQEESRQNMREVARAMALVVDKDLARREAILQTLATSSAIDRGDLKAFSALVQRAAPGPDTAIVLLDLFGRVLLNTRQAAVAPSPAGLSMMQDLRARYGPGSTIVSDLYSSSSGRGHGFSLQIPVWRNQRIAYYLQMSAFARHLQTVFDEQKLPAHWVATIVDRNGVVVARSSEPEQYVGKQATGPLLEKITGSDEGFNEGLSLNSEPVSAYFSRAPQSEWTFVVSVPQRQLQQSAVQATGLMGAVSFLLLALAVGVAFALGRVTATQIEALRRAAKRLGAGLPVAIERSGVWEIDAVNTALVKASDEIRRNQDELKRRVDEAVAIAQRSQQALLRSQKLEALGRLTGGIAHDFNNVLQTLTTGLQVAAYSAAEPRASSALEACSRAVDRASELVRQLMAFGRVQDAQLETVDLARQLRAMAPMLKSGLTSNIALQVEVAGDLWPVTMDPLQFELALLNLTINARDAMPAGGLLHVQADNRSMRHAEGDLVAGDYVCMSVTDTGEGMSEETLARAFDPFFTTKSIGKGSGLGLPQAYGFARQCGGVLMLDSRSGTGTTATFYLPRALQAPVQADQENPQPQLLVPGVCAETAAGAAILLVEDDALVREVIGPALETSGFRVTVAVNGDEAVRLLDAGMYFELVFSDVVMPGKISGIDLAELVCRRFPAMRVVLATGYSEQRFSMPGVRILAKPYDVSVMLQALTSQLQAARAAAGATAE